jgi:undecaprenyl-diphosphatase
MLSKYFSEKTKGWWLLVVALIFFILFAQLANLVTREQLTVFDNQVVDYMSGLRDPELTNIMLFVTNLGSTLAIVLISLLVIAGMWLTKHRHHISHLVISIISAGVFTYAFKQLFARARPELANALVEELNFSFPSGHTLIAICFYGVLIYFLVHETRPMWIKVLVFILGSALIVVIGISRIYLGVHWPTDVLGSLLLGGSWLCLLGALHEYRGMVGYILKK